MPRCLVGGEPKRMWAISDTDPSRSRVPHWHELLVFIMRVPVENMEAHHRAETPRPRFNP